MSTPPESISLRQFFVELLLDDNLAAYHDRAGRADYIEGSRLSRENKDLLLNGTLGEIEQQILSETYSPSGARPVLIVMPP